MASVCILLTPIAVWSRFIVYRHSIYRDRKPFLFWFVNIFLLYFSFSHWCWCWCSSFLRHISASISSNFRVMTFWANAHTSSTLVGWLDVVVCCFYDNDSHIDLMEFNRLKFIRRPGCWMLLSTTMVVVRCLTSRRFIWLPILFFFLYIFLLFHFVSILFHEIWNKHTEKEKSR